MPNNEVLHAMAKKKTIEWDVTQSDLNLVALIETLQNINENNSLAITNESSISDNNGRRILF